MDVSQLCSDPIAENSSMAKESSNSTKQYNIDFLLSSSEDSNNAPKSVELILTQCSKLCESIWQFKLQHKSSSPQEVDNMINSLSETASSLFTAIQTRKDKIKTKEPFLEEDEEEEEEEEDDNDNDEMDCSKPAVSDHAEYVLIRQARNLQNAHSRPKYRRRNRRSMIGQKCHSCSTTETPEWRRGPDGARTLCNACGLHYSKLLKKGSIGVQTQNYLIAAASRASASNSTRQQLAIAHHPTVNYPFILMGPKYETYQRQNNFTHDKPTSSSNSPISTASSFSHLSQSHYTQQLPPISSAFEDSPNFVNTTSSTTNFNDNNTISSFPSLSLNNGSNRPSPSTSENTITTLRIHQWKQNQ